MRFTFFAVGVPFCMALYQVAFTNHHVNMRHMGGFDLLMGTWLLIGIPCAVVYWLVRVIRHAWSK